MTTRLLLVRHGATILSAEDRFAGSTDVDLSEEGRDQARGLAERLAQKPLSAAFASPMKRTIETASIVGAPHGLTPVPVDGLREIDHGRGGGRWRGEVEAQVAGGDVGWGGVPGLVWLPPLGTPGGANIPTTPGEAPQLASATSTTVADWVTAPRR